MSNTFLEKETKILVKVYDHISHPISLGFQDLRQLTMKGNRLGNKEREIKSSSYIEGFLIEKDKNSCKGVYAGMMIMEFHWSFT